MAYPQLDELNLLHAHICTALGDPKRIQMMYVLHEKPRHVTALAEELDLPQPTVSRHLQVLRQRSLVTTVREGTAVIYHLADPRMIELLDAMRQLLRDALGRQASALPVNSGQYPVDSGQ